MEGYGRSQEGYLGKVQEHVFCCCFYLIDLVSTCFIESLEITQKRHIRKNELEHLPKEISKESHEVPPNFILSPVQWFNHFGRGLE